VSDISVLCVDDEKVIIDSIRDYLIPEYVCLTYDNPTEALEYLRERTVDILITDQRMPGISGLDLLKEARKAGAYESGILLTAYADKDLLKSVLNNGLVDIALEKPLDLPALKGRLDTLAGKIRRRREQQEKQKDIYRLLSAAGENGFMFIGKEGDLADLWKQAESAADTNENVLITGETGTGKDVLAKQIHGLSGRRDKPFIKINCGAIPSMLLESELFGHEKGAFSGAERKKFGKIELAHGGTLFLDEIGELPVELQSKLLHVVEDKALERVGGTEKIAIDFRLLSATNKDLGNVTADVFRRDLFYRISTVHLHLSDLKERMNDLPVHIMSLIGKNAKLFGKAATEISPEAMDLLCSHTWPGNIRELDNVLKRAVMMKGEKDTVLHAADFRHFLVGENGDKGSFEEALTRTAREMLVRGKSLQDVEQSLLEYLVKLCGGKVMEASRKTGIPKDRFYRLKGKTDA
jgi:DNA-binding NtrC family response regulator